MCQKLSNKRSGFETIQILMYFLDVNQLMEPTYDESIGKEELAEKEGKNR